MVENKPNDQIDRQNREQAEKPILNNPECMQVRNATGDQVEAIKAANSDRSDGSATPKNAAGRFSQALIDEQDKSIELCEGERVVAARVVEASSPTATVTERIEQQSKTIEELTRIAKVNPVYEPILGLRQHAENLPSGQEKDNLVQLAKDQVIETKALFQQSDSNSEDQESCGSHIYEAPQKPITIGQHSYSQDSLTAYDNKQSGIVCDATNARVAQDIPFDELDKRPIRDYSWGFKPNGKPVIEAGAQYLEGYEKQQIAAKAAEQQVFERVAALPIHLQVLVLHTGIQAYQQEIDHQKFRIAVGEIAGLGESVVGVARGADSLGKSICDVAQFSRDIAEDNPRAQITAAEAGHSLGKLLVGGFKVIGLADSYLGSVGAASVYGDDTKAFRDISELGHKMNERWQAMSPEEKTRLATKATIDNLGPIAAAGVGAKLAGSMDIAGALQELGASASVFGSKEREKYSKVIGKIAEKLTVQEMAATPDGRLMPVPKPRGLETSYETRIYRSPDTGMEHTPGEAAKLAGVDKKLGPVEKMKALIAKGYEVIEPKVYHVAGLEKPLSESAIAKKLGLTKEQLRVISPEKLGEHGITAIEPVRGVLPRNYKNAGKTFEFSKENPKEYKKLCRDFPEWAEEFSEGVKFGKNGYPNFSPFKQAKDYQFKKMFTGHAADFKEADEHMWPKIKTAKAREKCRQSLGLTWHHCEDGYTLQLVPYDLHRKVPHTGGIAIVKALKGK